MTSPQSLPVEEARKKFADLLDDSQFRSTHTAITRRGKTAGIVVPPEWYARAIEALEGGRAEEQRPAPTRRAAPAQKLRRTARPAPRDGRPLLEDEAKDLAALALKRASEMQGQKLSQLVANTAKGYEDYAVVSSALEMGLLTHDEVYGPASSEETSG